MKTIKIKTFNYANGQQVRIVDLEGEIWFLATDVCKIFGCQTSGIDKYLDDDELSSIF